MSALRVPHVPSSVRSTEAPKDLNQWHSKREVLHDLYILQRKRLYEVRTIMEREHGFPETLKDSDYEQILREEFKFRKNLSTDEWRLSIGPQIAGRKAQGKRSEVLLNGFKVQNVDRKISRSLQRKRLSRRTKAYIDALPYGIVIRTPSPRPSASVGSPTLATDLVANEVRDHEGHQTPQKSLADSRADAWLSLLTGAIPLTDAEPGATVVMSAQLLREGCPINKMLDEYQRKSIRADLRLFGPNSTIGLLGKMCFDFSNNLQDETISSVELASILDWIGFSVDIACLKAFFSQKVLTILAMWEALNATVRKWEHSAAFDVLLSVHLSITNQAPWTTGIPYDEFACCMEMAPNRVTTLINTYPCDQYDLDTALRVAVQKRGPIELVKQLISAGASLEDEGNRTSVDKLIRYFSTRVCREVDLTRLEMLLDAGAVVDEPPLYDRSMDWSRPNYPIHATDCMLLSGGHSTHNHRLWLLVSSYSDRQQTTVTVPGIFEAAKGGRGQLVYYLNARLKPYDDQDRQRVLEVALSEAAERGFDHVVQTLVQFGVDPNVSMLLQSHRKVRPMTCQNIWHPVIRAANSGQVNTLRVLVTVSSSGIALLDEPVDSQLDLCALRNMQRYQRDQILRILSTLDLSIETRSDILLYAIKPHRCGSGHDGPDFSFASQILELGLACLDSRNDLDAETPHILVRAIKMDCGIRALNYLVEHDVEVLSALSATTIGALLAATLDRYRYQERHAILEFLARHVEGFESYVQEQSSSLLLYFLENTSCHERYATNIHATNMEHWENDCDAMVTVKWFLDLGAPLKGLVLAKVIHHANETFILNMIRGDKGLDEMDDREPLKWSIGLGRFNLAVALIERGAQVNGPQGRGGGLDPLQQACKNGAPLWFIRFLIDRGADVNAAPASNGGRTALQAACYNGAELSCISFLINKGADVNAPPARGYGFTALQCAASQGLMNVAGLLLDHGADVNALSGFLPNLPPPLRFTRAIDLAALTSRLDMVHFLIAAGARSCQPGLTGFAGAVELATRERNFAVVCLLNEHSGCGGGDPKEAERRWLLKNPCACLYKGMICSASWAAFVRREGDQNRADVRKYMMKELDSWSRGWTVVERLK